jgi:polysaccharide biosynthesis transport protein
MLSSSDGWPRSLLVTSASAEEGKTTTASNLAIAMAQNDKKVLLVDSDLRRPRVHKLFGLDNKTGLSNYLAGQMESEIIQDGPMPNLKIIPSGPIPPNPQELLNSERLAKALRSWTEASGFQTVIFDSPPVLAVSDALVVSQIVQGAILVIKSNHTEHRIARKALQSLNDVGTRIYGLIINAIDPKKQKYYYDYYSGYAYDKYESETVKPKE